MISINSVNELGYATALCRREGIPYWLILQHALNHYFPADEAERARFERVVAGAARVVCVSRHNRRVLELAAGPRPAQRPDGHQRRDPRLPGPRRRRRRRQPGPGRRHRSTPLPRPAQPGTQGPAPPSGGPVGPAWAARDWRLRLVGGGPHAAQVARLVDYYGIARGRVEVCGHRDDVIAEVADSDLLVMPSLSEGTPYAMVEAMACGRPAVGTPVGGIPELVAEGRTGWLAESTEAPHLAAALERAWSDRRDWPRYGAEARRGWPPGSTWTGPSAARRRPPARRTAIEGADAGRVRPGGVPTGPAPRPQSAVAFSEREDLNQEGGLPRCHDTTTLEAAAPGEQGVGARLAVHLQPRPDAGLRAGAPSPVRRGGQRPGGPEPGRDRDHLGPGLLGEAPCYPELIDAVEQLSAPTRRTGWRRPARPRRTRSPGTTTPSTSPFWARDAAPTSRTSTRFALQAPIVDVANAYFNMFTRVSYFNIWHTFSTPVHARATQLWHRDPEDRYILKVFLYLSDVDDGAGPFTYAAGSHPRRGCAGSRRSPPTPTVRGGATTGRWPRSSRRSGGSRAPGPGAR